MGSAIRKSTQTIQIEFSISHTLNHPKTWEYDINITILRNDRFH